MDQVFAVRKLCKKYLANGKNVFWAFMDLEKADDMIDHMADTKSVLSYRKIVEIGAEFLSR